EAHCGSSVPIQPRSSERRHSRPAAGCGDDPGRASHEVDGTDYLVRVYDIVAFKREYRGIECDVGITAQARVAVEVRATALCKAVEVQRAAENGNIRRIHDRSLLAQSERAAVADNGVSQVTAH